MMEINKTHVSSMVKTGSSNNNVNLKKLKEACAEFESLFYQLLFKEARKGIEEGSLIKKSHMELFFTEMMDNEVARQIAYRSENGIKDMLFNDLTRSLGKNVKSKDIKIDLIG